MRIKITHTGKEDLAVDSEAAAHLHQLADLLQLRGERIIGREDGGEWRGRGDRFGKNTGVPVGILANHVVSLNQAEAALEAEEALRQFLPCRALRCAFTARHAAQVAGDNRERISRLAVAENGVARHRGDHRDRSVGVVTLAQQIAHAARPAGGSGGRLRRVLPLQLLIGMAEKIGRQV